MSSILCVVMVTLSSVQYSYADLPQKFADLPIQYPGPTKRTTYNRFSAYVEYQPYEIPDECKDQNYCTIKPKNYPQQRFNTLFNGKTFVPQPEPDTEDGTDNRQGNPDEKDGCDSTVKFEPIYNVKTLKGEWRTVIQASKHNFVQKVRLESCKKPGSSCFSVFPFTSKFETSCKQKYSTWEILVDGEKGVETVKINLPICCSCVYRTASLGKMRG